MFKALKQKLFARKVKALTQEGCDMYVEIFQSMLKPMPQLAEDIATVVVNNQDEIEAALVTARKVGEELKIVLEKHKARVNAENKELTKIMVKFEKQFAEFSKLIK